MTGSDEVVVVPDEFGVLVQGPEVVDALEEMAGEPVTTAQKETPW